MLEISKDDVKSKADELANQSNQSSQFANDASGSIRSKINEVGDGLSNKADTTKNEINQLIKSFKDLLAEYSDPTKIKQLKGQLTDKAQALKEVVSDEVSTAYYTGKQKATETVRENPLGTLALVAGAGLMIGFILGVRQSNKE